MPLEDIWETQSTAENQSQRNPLWYSIGWFVSEIWHRVLAQAKWNTWIGQTDREKHCKEGGKIEARYPGCARKKNIRQPYSNKQKTPGMTSWVSLMLLQKLGYSSEKLDQNRASKEKGKKIQVSSCFQKCKRAEVEASWECWNNCRRWH